MESRELILYRQPPLNLLCATPPKVPLHPCRFGAQQPTSTRTASRQGAPDPARNNLGKPTCQCGKCRVCVSNARWERIYNERFADPGYYGGLRFRNRSPLAGF